MILSKELLEKRRAIVVGQRDENLAALHAATGAIAEIDHLLKLLELSPPAAASDKSPPPPT